MDPIRYIITASKRDLCGEARVLFPLEVNEADKAYEDEFGSALQEGLLQRYEVYYGPDVKKELEKEYPKVDCNVERCIQNVALAFNG